MRHAPLQDVRGRYQRSDADMTLREGLAEYYRVNPELALPSGLEKPDAATYFSNHDVTHVVFGTHTAPLDEGINDLWTVLGVDIRLRDYAGGFAASGEAGKILKQFGPLSTLRILWQTLRLLPELRRRTRAMTRKWPWSPPPELLDRRLDALRAEWGIRILGPEFRQRARPQPRAAGRSAAPAAGARPLR